MPPIERNHQDNGRDNATYIPTVQAIAQEAAERAVVNVLLRMGIDPEDHEGLKSLRENLSFLARMNRGANHVGSLFVKTCAGAAIMAFLWMLATGFKEWLHLLPWGSGPPPH